MQNRFSIEPISDKNESQPSSANSRYSIEPIESKSNNLFSGLSQGMENNPIQPLYHPQAPMNLIEGINEGGESGVNAIFGKNIPLSKLPEDSWNAGFKDVGRDVGRAASASAIAAPVAMSAGGLGFPAAGNIAGAFAGGAAAHPGNLFQRAVAGVKDAALPAAIHSALKLPGVWKALSTPLNPRGIYSKIQNAHDLSGEEASNLFEKVKNEGINRNIPNIDSKVMEDPVNESISMLPKAYRTPEFKDLAEKAKSGDYQSVRDFQSDLRTIGDELRKSAMTSERKIGRTILQKRNLINKGTIKHLEDSGNEDLAKDLQNAVDKYRQYKNLYYKNSTVRKLVSGDRAEPVNFSTAFDRKSDSIAAIKAAHPEIEEELNLMKNKKSIEKTLNKLKGKIKPLGLAGLVGGGYYAGRGSSAPDIIEIAKGEE